MDNINEKIKVAIYARVSTRDQLESLEEQKRRLIKYAEAKEYEIIDIFSEVASGAQFEREQLNQMMNKMTDNHPYDAILISKLDRLSRSLNDMLNTAKILEKNNVQLISEGDNVDTSSPAGRLLFHLLGAIAEFERDIIKERMQIGIERAKREGKKCYRHKKVVDMKKVKDYIDKGLSQTDIASLLKISTVTLWKHMKDEKIKIKKTLEKT